MLHSMFREFIKIANEYVHRDKELLTQLDSRFGDGDLGITMTKGFSAAVEALERSEETNLAKLSQLVGMTFAKAVPSTMGTLVAFGFMNYAKNVKDKDVSDNEMIVLFYKYFAESIMEKGKALLGNRTIVDSMYPAYLAALASFENQDNMETIALRAKDAAKDGVEKTKNMLATFGRAVYFGEQVIGTEDQGAIVGKIICEALYDACKNI